MDLIQLLKSRLLTGFLGLMLVLVMIGTAQILIHKFEVDREIANLKQEAEEINQKNLELTNLVKYLDTPEYGEKQAREQLNLKKEGEFVVALPQSDPEKTDSTAANQEISNTTKWFNYFFGS